MFEEFLAGFYPMLEKDHSLHSQLCGSDKFNCAEVLLISFSEAVSKYKEYRDPWWSAVHSNVYTHMPFSEVPGLSLIFTWSSPSRGNRNTLACHPERHHEYFKTGRFDSMTGPNYKMIVDFGGRSLFGIDTGVDMNLFNTYMFILNWRFLKNDLWELDPFKEKGNYVLTFNGDT